MDFQNYDAIKLCDGRTGSIIETLDDKNFLVELDMFFDEVGEFVGADDYEVVVFVCKDDIVEKF